jgi:hypothetical protein
VHAVHVHGEHVGLGRRGCGRHSGRGCSGCSGRGCSGRGCSGRGCSGRSGRGGSRSNVRGSSRPCVVCVAFHHWAQGWHLLRTAMKEKSEREGENKDQVHPQGRSNLKPNAQSRRRAPFCQSVCRERKTVLIFFLPPLGFCAAAAARRSSALCVVRVRCGERLCMSSAAAVASLPSTLKASGMAAKGSGSGCGRRPGRQ